MILTKGTKELLINSVDGAFPFRFTKPDAANPAKQVTATAADATRLAIQGYGDFALASLAIGSTVTAIRARAAQTNIVSIDAAVASQITTSGQNPAGAAITILVRLHSTDPIAEYITGDPGRYFRTQAYTFGVPQNATAAQVVAGLYAQINGRQDLYPEAQEPIENQVTATLAGDKITLTCADAHVRLEVKINDLDPTTAALVPVLAPSIDQQASPGRGQYRTLQGGRLQTEGTNGEYNIPGPLELPQKGKQYAAISFETVTVRPDLSGHGAADSSVSTGNKFLVYVQEGAGEETIADLVNFLSRSDAGVRKYYADKTSDDVTKAAFLANA